MSDYVAKGGTTALGIIGTVLGSLATVGELGGAGSSGGIFSRSSSGNSSVVCERDLTLINALAQKDAEIAKYQSEKYTDTVGLQLYQYIDGRLRNIEQNINDNNTTQLLVNERLNATNVALTSQLNQMQTVLSNITGVAVKQNMVVDFGCCGN